MQAAAEEQDIAVRLALVVPLGRGMGRSVHVLPFHCSPATTGWLVLPVVKDAAAMQAAAEEQDIAVRLALVVPLGRGMGRSVHVLPFHCSPATTGWLVLPVVKDAAAMQAAAEEQDSADRLPVSGLA